jgi:flagellar motor switch protein FliN/FliY
MDDTFEPLSDLPEPAAEPEPEAAPVAAAPSPAVPSPAAPAGPPRYDAILSIPVTVQVVLGGTTMPVSSLMKLGRGAVVSLDQKVGDPVNIVVNGRTIARGEVVVVDEETARYGVSLTEIVASSRDDRVA